MTVIINTQEEFEALINDGNDIIIYDDLVINCDIDIDVWDIEAYNINARNIGAYNRIKATNIEACNINAENIDAENIKATNIEACNINARNIEAKNIDANNINAYNIDVHNISYDAFCIAHQSLKCKTIEGGRKNAVHLCLDQPIEYIK